MSELFNCTVYCLLMFPSEQIFVFACLGVDLGFTCSVDHIGHDLWRWQVAEGRRVYHLVCNLQLTFIDPILELPRVVAHLTRLLLAVSFTARLPAERCHE